MFLIKQVNTHGQYTPQKKAVYTGWAARRKSQVYTYIYFDRNMKVKLFRHAYLRNVLVSGNSRIYGLDPHIRTMKRQN